MSTVFLDLKINYITHLKDHNDSDKKVLEKMREITRKDFENHPNPNLDVKVMTGDEMNWKFITDVFFRIKNTMEAGEKLVMILPQPWPAYARVADMLNKCNVDCRKLYTFNMDEYADQDGNIAPESWPYGFTHALKKYFYNNLDPKLRPLESQMVGLSNENINDYGQMITDLGGADICYSGPGWTGHIAFTEPANEVSPELPTDLEEFKQWGPGIVTLSPFTLAQNSLHGSFGMSGDIAAVPPKAATIGPAQYLEAKEVISSYGISIQGTHSSWQRLTTRLALFGPVTPLVPDSIIQLRKATAWVSDVIAAPIEVDWNGGY
jgi:6-phosphogluconolactonase/glucosamine-6-phosphate isomerase/deaminase